MTPVIPNQPQPPGTVAATPRRVFTRTSEDGPAPLFINAIELSALGMDVFMDVGIVPPESVAKIHEVAKSGTASSPSLVDLFVTARYGMSIQTAIMFHQRLTQMLQQVGEQQQTQLGGIVPSPAPTGTSRKRPPK